MYKPGDELRKIVFSPPELMQTYRGFVPVPPLEMVDDMTCNLDCSPQSMQVNLVVNSLMNLKKLMLNSKNVSMYTLKNTIVVAEAQ